MSVCASGRKWIFSTPWPRPRPKIPPDPRLICACTFWSPAPSGSFHGSRNVSSRARRYGDDQAASVPSATTIAGRRDERSAAACRTTSSIAATMTTIVIAVPRSGSTSTSRQKSPTRAPIGRNSSFSVCGGGRRARYAAVQTTSASFASSDGWNASGAESDPAARAVDPLADHEHGDAEAECGDDQHRRERAQLAEVASRGDDEERRRRSARRRPAVRDSRSDFRCRARPTAEVAL